MSNIQVCQWQIRDARRLLSEGILCLLMLKEFHEAATLQKFVTKLAKSKFNTGKHFFIDLKRTLKIQNRYISMYQPQRGRTLGHLVSTAAGPYNSTILDTIRKEKQKKDKQVKGRDCCFVL